MQVEKLEKISFFFFFHFLKNKSWETSKKSKTTARVGMCFGRKWGFQEHSFEYTAVVIAVDSFF
jgi:hypothetical protein